MILGSGLIFVNINDILISVNEEHNQRYKKNRDIAEFK